MRARNPPCAVQKPTFVRQLYWELQAQDRPTQLMQVQRDEAVMSLKMLRPHGVR